MAPRDEGRIDFSLLDPTADPRFEQRIRRVMEQASRPPDAPTLMIRWWRLALALAASIALAAWLPGSLAQETVVDPATALLQWAQSGGPTTAAEVLHTLGRTR